MIFDISRRRKQGEETHPPKRRIDRLFMPEARDIVNPQNMAILGRLDETA